MLNFNFPEEDLRLVSPPHFLCHFSIVIAMTQISLKHDTKTLISYYEGDLTSNKWWKSHYKIFNSFLSFSKIISYLIWNTVTWTLLESTLICRHDVIVNIWYHQVFPASLPQVQFACPLKVFSDTPLERLVKVKRTHSFHEKFHQNYKETISWLQIFALHHGLPSYYWKTEECQWRANFTWICIDEKIHALISFWRKHFISIKSGT